MSADTGKEIFYIMSQNIHNIFFGVIFYAESGIV